MRKLYWTDALLLAALILAVAATAMIKPPVENFTVSGDGQDVVVYNRFPDNFSDNTIAANNGKNTVWLDASKMNASEMQDNCDYLVLRNTFRPMGELTDEWYWAVAEKNNQEVCEEAVSRAESNARV